VTALRLQIARDLKSAEGALCVVLQVWAIVAAQLPGLGMSVKVVSGAAAALALASLCVKAAATADSYGLETALLSVQGSWAVVGANLGQVGVSLKVVNLAGTGLALAVFCLQRAVQVRRAPTPAVPPPLPPALSSVKIEGPVSIATGREPLSLPQELAELPGVTSVESGAEGGMVHVDVGLG
jgi:hypothetical protein